MAETPPLEVAIRGASPAGAVRAAVQVLRSARYADRSKRITTNVCEHHSRESMGSMYDVIRLTIIPFDAPDAGTSGVRVAHPRSLHRVGPATAAE